MLGETEVTVILKEMITLMPVLSWKSATYLLHVLEFPPPPTHFPSFLSFSLFSSLLPVFLSHSQVEYKSLG